MATPTVLTLLVPEEAEGERLDKFLAASLPQYSREYLQKLIRESCVSREADTERPEKKLPKPAFSLEEGDVLRVAIPEVIPLTLEPEAIPLEVPFEDEHFLVVNKPKGMLTHPTGREKTGTLVNAILAHCEGRLSNINGVERPGIVHRLDRDTTGLLVIAKTDIVHRQLQAQLQARELKREYRAIVQGVVKPQAGVVDAPIGRSLRNRDKMAVVESGGRHAVTHWQVVQNYHNRYTGLELRLETGRTHQIRVHVAHMGHPIVGDPLYGTGLENTQRVFEGGQVLQAFRLGVTHPVTGERLTFELPPDAHFERVSDWLSRC
jgi:23S rRNA pseudouridine1911/1915/1917 synthase